MSKLYDALKSVGDPPCDSCSMADRCADRLLACADFARYVDPRFGAEGRWPSRAWYREIFKAVDEDEKCFLAIKAS